MDLTLYKPSPLEAWICDIYKNNGIMTARDLDIEHIASIFNVLVQYVDYGDSRVQYDEDFGLITINDMWGEKEARSDFFHELGHVALHVGDQHKMPESFVELQEIQANLFSNYAGMPAYMLKDYLGVKTSLQGFELLLSEEFRLPLHVVRKRFEQIKNRVYDRFTYSYYGTLELKHPIFHYDWRYSFLRRSSY